MLTTAQIKEYSEMESALGRERKLLFGFEIKRGLSNREVFGLRLK